MSRKFYFAGGGTGGHIYPAIAIAEKVQQLDPEAEVHFFCSDRPVDESILSKYDHEFTKIPAKGFSIKPGKLIEFFVTFIKSRKIANEEIGRNKNAMVVGIGGFTAAPVCWAGRKLSLPVALVNIDSVPGKANKVISRFSDRIFVQFEESGEYFKNRQVVVSGCPLRKGFDEPQPAKATEELGLDGDKKTLLVTGASSGAKRINEAVCMIGEQLDKYADQWQVVHLAGISNFEGVRDAHEGRAIKVKVVDYYEDMASLLSSADLVIGRAGAVSVAEYIRAGRPVICMPYPHHKDRHQYHNAAKLVEAGAGIIVDDVADLDDRAGWLWDELEPLLADSEKLEEMRRGYGGFSQENAARIIAENLLEMI